MIKKDYLITKDLSIIKHIPHASLKLPEGYYFMKDYTKYIYKMADIGVDDLFKFIDGIEIKARYSRLFCDVERFKDNSKEPMAKLGQGYMYKKTYDGKLIHRLRKINGVNWIKFINKYYDEHNKNLNDAVKKEIKKGKEVLILDLHSYSDEMADSIGNKGPYPDICIGINEDFNNKPLLNLIISKIKEKGYSYKINFPYKGAIVPSDVINKKIKGKVYSIMIEVNKRLYL